MSDSSILAPPSCGYPTPIEAPAVAATSDLYKNAPENNPTVSGLPLVVLSKVVHYTPFVAKLLWNNAGFGVLRNLKVIENYPTRHDPTVVPRSSLIDDADSLHPLFSKPDPAYYSSAEYVAAYKSKRTTPTAVAEYLLSLISSPPHNLAFVEINEELTLAAARASTERYAQGREIGPLDGVPITVKDEVDVHGYKTTLGSARVFATEDCKTSWAVTKLEEAGAVIVGKANMHEIGSDTTNNNPVKGSPRNPYNEKYYPGGSSGGPAYAVAAGLVPISVGADGGGSIRIPATYCGIYGIKPSHGRISGRPTVGLSSGNGVVGPIAATLDDLALAYRILSAPDPQDPTSAAFPPPNPLLTPIPSPSRSRKILGIFRPWFDDSIDAVRTRCQAAVDKLVEKFDYEVVEIELPFLNEARVAHALSIICEMYDAIAPQGVRDLNAANRVLMNVASCTPARDLLCTARVRSLIMSHLAHIFTAHPGIIIVTPTLPMVGVRIGNEGGELKYGVSDTNTSLRSMRYVFLANFSGCPAVVSGVGYDDAKGGKNSQSGSGLSVSLMGMAEWGAEETLIGFAKDVANATISADDVGEGEGRRRGKIWADVLGAVGAGRNSA